MFLVRDIMYCRPGKARAMVDKFLALSAISQQLGMGPTRVMTDISAERYWTVVSEMEVASLQAFEDMMSAPPGGEDAMKEFEQIMKGYHDLVDKGRREIYKIES